MATTIVTKYGGDAPAASDIVRGELAVDTENGRLYTENSSGAVVEIGLNPEGNIDVTGSVTADGLVVDGASSGSTVATFTANSNVDTPLLVFQRSGGAVAGKIAYDDTNTAITFGTTTNHEIRFLTNNTEKMQLDASGSVGIGVVPSAKFHVKASANTYAGGFRLEGVDETTALGIAHVNGDNFFSGNATDDHLVLTGSGNVGIGVSAPNEKLESSGAIRVLGTTATSANSGTLSFNGTLFNIESRGPDTSNRGTIGFYQATSNGGSGIQSMLLDASGKVGIGQSTITNPYSQTPFTDVNINGTWGGVISFQLGGVTKGWVGQRSSGNEDMVIGATTGQELLFYENNVEAARISSGNLLVGKTALDNSTVGIRMNATGDASFVADGTRPLVLNRKTSDGDIALFLKDGTTVGSIGCNAGSFGIGQSTTGLGFYHLDRIVFPATNAGATQDNQIDLGYAGARFDDIYATNNIIQTSDRNEKQDIEALSEAEQRVAVASKGLLRKFRWKSSVAEKGDEARTHFGIIAQDLQAAFAAEGLDAGDYAMFINSTWTDEETGEERSRMGVRYSELLAFIIAAI